MIENTKERVSFQVEKHLKDKLLEVSKIMNKDASCVMRVALGSFLYQMSRMLGNDFTDDEVVLQYYEKHNIQLNKMRFIQWKQPEKPAS